MSAIQKIPQREIFKIGLAVMDGTRVLLVKKKGGFLYILPGGKPEQGEQDIDTLHREIQEELGCSIMARSLKYVGSFEDAAADMKDTTVVVKLYKGRLKGEPSPQSEIETLKWVGDGDDDSLLAPSLRNQILPFLFSRAVAT